jgi:16S rRNA G966 N2-methylase RsmD
VPYLIEVLEGMKTLEWPEVVVTQQDAGLVTLDQPRKNVVVYIDPNYVSSTGYINGFFSRERVVATALKWAHEGAMVIVSEAEPIESLVEEGWKATQLEIAKKNKSPFKGKKSEWVTVSP